MAITTKELIRFCRRIQAEALIDALEAYGVTCEYISHGLSREVYKVPNLPLVLKVESGRDPWQSKNEVAAIRLINRKPQFAQLRQYVPKIYYAKTKAKSGGVILAEYYPLTSDDVSLEEYQQGRKRLQELFAKHEFTDIQEISTINIRFTENRQPVAIDLGCSVWRPACNS
jgi:hypothetical protein